MRAYQNCPLSRCRTCMLAFLVCCWPPGGGLQIGKTSHLGKIGYSMTPPRSDLLCGSDGLQVFSLILTVCLSCFTLGDNSMQLKHSQKLPRRSQNYSSHNAFFPLWHDDTSLVSDRLYHWYLALLSHRRG